MTASFTFRDVLKSVRNRGWVLDLQQTAPRQFILYVTTYEKEVSPGVTVRCIYDLLVPDRLLQRNTMAEDVISWIAARFEQIQATGDYFHFEDIPEVPETVIVKPARGG